MEAKNSERKFGSWLASQLAQCPEILPLARLVLLFHAANCPVANPTIPQNKAEARNVRLLQMLLPANHLGLAGVTYKPATFIHPFESHYSLPGYLDQIVLPYFYRAVDCAAKDQSPQAGAEFLAFVYVFFLLVHPLVDANGRVARNLLDYYNTKLSLGLKPVWHQEKPIKFKERQFHKDAFRTFFEKEAELAPFKRRDPYTVLDELKAPVAHMADHLIHWAVVISRDPRELGKWAWASVRTMATGIKKLSGEAARANPRF